jgi:L-serine kinase (ADP)
VSEVSEIELVPVSTLKHIEGFSQKRVLRLEQKILREGRWIKPVVIDASHHLVMDGQHRMEVALKLGLKFVPAVKYEYCDVKIWSLRPKTHEFDWQAVVQRSVRGDIYPYKTVKHAFPNPLPKCEFNIEELK